MNIPIKTAEEIDKMRVAGRLAAEVLELLDEHVRPGITTGELNRIAHHHITEVQGCIPAPLNYHGFPKSICTSINHVVCHGIPDDNKKLKKGDILNIDITVIKDGYHGDTSKMYFVGEPSIQAERLCRITQECLYKGIELVRPGVRLSEIGRAIQKHAEAAGYSVVRDFCGHGIGAGFHEDPQVLHYDGYETRADAELLEGMCLTIEPMVNVGGYKVKVLKDDWTAVTKDKSLSAQWEHTLLVTATGVEVLTRRTEEDLSFLEG
ncbi:MULTISPECIES: type I methionyl aminopeptidase [unclassified Cobetia]|uniref:type I methionyl aminopeptidase n=1 Tax=unclassified Cobetia TaxID=2609414 RepID=UPI0020968E5F|nr:MULTISPECIES: type I methionyl aminopeptidase [unclassified Cobetia]MCO7233370.1 type I methionyl aminopeptidase [Cobetia sp. Dlab-2-AX]MCO7236566.1 type I methionyl aminopeptidase [Cobetia sp. Dlab-2-U]